MSVCCPPACLWTVVCQLCCRRSAAGWRGTCATRTLYGVISRWAVRGVGAVGGRRRRGRGSAGTGRTAEAAHFANKSLSYLYSSKFAILRLLCDALSKSKLSSCHQYSISCSWKLFSCASGSLSRHMQYLCSKILIWIGVWSGVSSGSQWPGWKNAMFI